MIVSGLSEVIAWFVAWPGLDPKAFFQARTVDRPGTFEWMFAVAKTGLGGWMLIGMAPALRAESDLLAGWSALIGIGSHHPGATLSGFGLLILGIAF